MGFHKEHRLPTVILRPSMVYGPRCIARLIMFKYIQKGWFPLFRKGQGHMEFCYIDNLIDAILLAESNDSAVGQRYNVSDGQSYSMKEVAGTIAKELDVKLTKIPGPVILAKIMGFCIDSLGKVFGFYHPFSHYVVDWMSYDRCVYDVSKIKNDLAYSPAISLGEGVRRSVQWYREKNLL